ncbi:helix-turn-helix domain-containing protein [Allosalinactinospora lopnorensis]|uniref:helix-turn-helix domain-containing protein n=1 Tax=Allosalinactinospora lopnorensis TaxID=1352348 RepID=UPI000B0F3F78|nr:helix-turn-helix domain-containing protein [Allosalinactinospora lopnorensis]
MVRGAHEDARGIIAPDAGLVRFRLDRYAPSEQVARFVDRYWLASWDLSEPYTQRVFAHPVVNVVFTAEEAAVHGVATRVSGRRLAGRGWALGVMFRPAGFRPLLDRPMATIRDAALDLAGVFGPASADIAAAVRQSATAEDRAAAVDGFLTGRLPEPHHPAEDTAALVERVAADPAIARVEALAAEEGVSVRRLQRRFADHVGVSPKAVIRRYRLYEAAERVRHGARVDWAGLAGDLGYSDQPHLTRDFTAVIGLPPQRYTLECAARSRP